jgi:hypothetical protein
MEEAKYFRNFREITSREAFDADCEITVESFASLIGEYHFAEEEVSCQVRRLDQSSRCSEGHKNGWLGRRKDGKEALIGRICGGKYFNASSAFVAQRKRITSELNITRYIERLQATRGDSAYASDLQRTIGRLKVVREAAGDWRERLPARTITRLQQMAKSGNSAVGVQFRYEDEDDIGNPIVDWVQDQIGVVSGVAIFDQSKVGVLFQALHGIRDTLCEAYIDRAAGERRLRQWADKLDQLSSCSGRVAELESALESFSEPSNLRLLCFLVPNQDIGMTVARVVIKQESGADAATSSAARALYNELSASVRARAAGRDFRVVW